MAIFGLGKGRAAIQQALAGDWSSPEEKAALLEALRQDPGLRGVDALRLYLGRDAELRILGRDAFVARPDPRAVQQILDAVAQQSGAQRQWLLQAIGALPEAAVRPALDAAFAAAEPGARRLAYELALVFTGPSREGYVERVAREARGPLRAQAVRALATAEGGAGPLERWLAFAHDEDPRVRQVAGEVLAAVRTPEVFARMVGWLREGAPEARETAARYLRDYATARPAEVREQLLEMLASGEDATRHLALELLFATGSPREVLLEVLEFSRSLIGWVRERLLHGLTSLGEDVIRPAVDLLGHPEPEVRAAALVLAETVDDPRLVLPLTHMLKDEDWWLRVVAADRLGKLGDARAVPALVEALEDPDSRWAALDALSAIGAPDALQPIARMAKDERREVRLEVVQALGRFDDKRMVRFLQRIAETDASLEVRTRATEVANALAARLSMPEHIEETRTAVVSLEQLDKPLDRLLAKIREDGASDLHLAVDEPPIVRRHGRLSRLDMRPLEATKIETLLFGALSPEQQARLRATGDLDFSYEVPEVGRYRANAFRKHTGLGASFRVIPNLPPTFGELGLPAPLAELPSFHQGVLLVTGPAGSGKTTTLSALINLLNETKPCHILTLESPIELVHPAKLALVNQREIGRHSQSYARALRGALRQDPDVIVVGELLDAETTRMSLTAAETGHLVIATMPTNSAVATIDRLVESFPPDEQPVARMSLSESLLYVLSQRLLPRADGEGRVGLFELLRNTPAVSGMIREGKTHQIPSAMQVGASLGMLTVDAALAELVARGRVRAEEAALHASHPEAFAPSPSPEARTESHA
jgi:twitching motility protein PilT